MDLVSATYSDALAAGVLSLLSPAVVLLVPAAIASGASAHRFSALAVSGGIAVSFTALGVFAPATALAPGLDRQWFRDLAATLLVPLGVLIFRAAAERGRRSSAALDAAGASLLGRADLDRLLGPFVVGLLLGAVWTPCAAPAPDAAADPATGGDSLHAAARMVMFALGAALPLTLFGKSVAHFFARESISSGLHHAVGISLIAVGLSVLVRADSYAEMLLAQRARDWLSTSTPRHECPKR